MKKRKAQKLFQSIPKILKKKKIEFRYPNADFEWKEGIYNYKYSYLEKRVYWSSLPYRNLGPTWNISHTNLESHYQQLAFQISNDDYLTINIALPSNFNKQYKKALYQSDMKDLLK